jgi:hypothetical protein
MIRTKVLRTGLFATMTAAALGFGGAQAFAAPAGVSDARACAPAPFNNCPEYCQSIGYDTGTCVGGGYCKCWFY